MRTTLRNAGALSAAIVLLLSAGPPALAADPAFEIEFDAGVACSFPLHVAAFGEGPQAFKTFTDRDGRERTITAGRGHALTFTNVDTGATVSTRSNGGAARTQTNADGTVTVELTGHNLLILFPSDVPAGPSTIVHSGRVVFDVDTDDVFTVESVAGRQLDVCAAIDD